MRHMLLARARKLCTFAKDRAFCKLIAEVVTSVAKTALWRSSMHCFDLT